MNAKKTYDFFADTTMKAITTLTEVGLPEEQAKIAAIQLWKVYLSGFRGLNELDQGKKVIPSVKAEIKLLHSEKPNGRRQRKKWGVRLTIDDTSLDIPFGSKEQTLIYVCTLLRKKIGERMYRHEFFNNSKGHKSRLNRNKSYRWLKAVYDTLFNSCSTDYNTWFRKVQDDNGHSLDQGKSQANNVIKKALKEHPEAMPYCIVNTLKDENKDSFYSIDIKSDNITIPKGLEFLVSDFYDMVDLKPAE